jgi:putative chitinase
MRLDKKKFFESLRRRDSGVFGTSLTQRQVDGVEAILHHGSHLPQSWLAYALATAYGETGRRMQPITEDMNYSAARIPRVFGPHRLKGYTATQLAGKPELLANVVYSDRLGNGSIASGDGWRYRGHGLVQLTGKDNFRKLGKLIGVDLVAEPERALDLDIAARALIIGIEDGLYTGKKAADFLPSMGLATLKEMKAARRIINDTFEALKYARYAMAFQEALEYGEYAPGSRARSVGITAPGVPRRDEPEPVAPPYAPKERGLGWRILERLYRFLFH